MKAALKLYLKNTAWNILAMNFIAHLPHHAEHSSSQAISSILWQPNAATKWKTIIMRLPTQKHVQQSH